MGIATSVQTHIRLPLKQASEHIRVFQNVETDEVIAMLAEDISNLSFITDPADWIELLISSHFEDYLKQHNIEISVPVAQVRSEPLSTNDDNEEFAQSYADDDPLEVEGEHSWGFDPQPYHPMHKLKVLEHFDFGNKERRDSDGSSNTDTGTGTATSSRNTETSIITELSMNSDSRQEIWDLKNPSLMTPLADKKLPTDQLEFEDSDYPVSRLAFENANEKLSSWTEKIETISDTLVEISKEMNEIGVEGREFYQYFLSFDTQLKYAFDTIRDMKSLTFSVQHSIPQVYESKLNLEATELELTKFILCIDSYMTSSAGKDLDEHLDFKASYSILLDTWESIKELFHNVKMHFMKKVNIIRHSIYDFSQIYHYKVKGIIGSGSFSTVFLVKDKRKRKYAMKVSKSYRH